MKTMKAAELILDFDLYPRNNVDADNIANMVQAILAGVDLPPVVIDKKTKRVADGFHRVRATLRANGDDATINVVEKSYQSDAELFLDAARYNAAHGARLDKCDKTHCLIVAERLGIPDEAIAGALHILPDRLGQMRETRIAASTEGLSVALKRTVSSFAGRRLNKRQVECNRKLSGMSQVFYANQLIELIEARMLDLSDEKLIERLQVLHGLLDGVLAVK